MTVIQRLELLAKDVEKLQSEGGGGGDLSAYLTKEEASSTYETQSAATASLALKVDIPATSTAALPQLGPGTTFDTGIEWSYIQTRNDFILDSSEQKIKFRYGFTKGSYLHYFGYALGSGSVATIVHLALGAPTGSGTTALAEWISSGAIPTT